jgi:hypothetical protein
VFAGREAKASEVAVNVAHCSTPRADQVMVCTSHGVEASGTCSHVELLDLTQRHQVVEGLVDGAQRDPRHLFTQGLENRMCSRMGTVAVQNFEDALALARDLKTAIPEQLGQLDGRLHFAPRKQSVTGQP